MKKIHKEYLKKYANISNDYVERFHDLVMESKLKGKEVDRLRETIPKLIHRKWNEIGFDFYMIPKPTSRPRSTSLHKRFYVKDASDNNALFKSFIEECTDINFTIVTPVKMEMRIYSETPSSMNRLEKICAELKLIHNISRPDFDNFAKTYADMIQGYFLLDDSLIVESTIKKFYSIKPRIEIRMKFADLYDCKFNKRKVESWNTYKELKDRIFVEDSIL